jgi:hypothetical protein
VGVSDIWHLFAGLMALVLSLVVGISTWMLKTILTEITFRLQLLDGKVDHLSDRVAILEGRLSQ